MPYAHVSVSVRQRDSPELLVPCRSVTLDRDASFLLEVLQQRLALVHVLHDNHAWMPLDVSLRDGIRLLRCRDPLAHDVHDPDLVVLLALDVTLSDSCDDEEVSSC